MPQTTMEVFRWSGTGYRATYNESFTAVYEDDDGNAEGYLDSDERVSIDGGAFNGTNSQPYSIQISFTDVDGNDHVETFNFFHTSDGGWYFSPLPGSEFTVGATLGSYQSHTVGWSYSDVVCFASGTMIDTLEGTKPVEALIAGDTVITRDGTPKPLMLNMSRQLGLDELQENPKLYPVRISAGALGEGLPHRDLLVSRQHRMLITSKIAERMFGAPEVLISAIRLTDLPGIFVDEDVQSVTYHHLLLENHQIIFAEGAPTESLLTGAEAMQTLAPEQLEELQILFPALQDMNAPQPASKIPTAKGQKKLVARHGQNQQPLHRKSAG
ncbi:MAG: Hint domain-containing protein [Cognatishimia sp.]|uniref:Hint domain-containing protein n=1 Tax=Cognatishimia sp. TaxID=2211648 RepID=UPI003B8B1BB1